MSRGVDFFTWSLSMTVRWRGFHDRVVWLWTWHIYITPSAKHHGATDKTDQGLQKHKCKETFPLWHVCSILFSNKEMLSLNNNWSTHHSIFQEVQHNLVTSKELHRSSQHCGVTIHRNLVAVFKDHLRSLLWEGGFAVLAFFDVDQGIWNCGLQLDLLSLSVTEYLFWFLKKVHELDRTAERHVSYKGRSETNCRVWYKDRVTRILPTQTRKKNQIKCLHVFVRSKLLCLCRRPRYLQWKMIKFPWFIEIDMFQNRNDAWLCDCQKRNKNGLAWHIQSSGYSVGHLSGYQAGKTSWKSPRARLGPRKFVIFVFLKI